MARILIPTRNRSTSLLVVLQFLDRFYPNTKVIIADGSNDQYAAENKGNLATNDLKIEVDYRRYDYEIPFFDRILDVLRDVSDEYIIMGSDDDLPLMDTMKKAEKLLDKDPGAVLAMGAMVHLFLKADDQIHARLGLARPILGQEAIPRCRLYAAWPYSTTYAVTRREHLIERYERARNTQLCFWLVFLILGSGCTTLLMAAYAQLENLVISAHEITTIPICEQSKILFS